MIPGRIIEQKKRSPRIQSRKIYREKRFRYYTVSSYQSDESLTTETNVFFPVYAPASVIAGGTLIPQSVARFACVLVAVDFGTARSKKAGVVEERAVPDAYATVEEA